MRHNTATPLEDDGDMPDQSRVTLCPQCQTGFRVTPEQLQAAAGQVRCGSCLHVFLAAEHWAPAEPGDTESPDDDTATAPDSAADAVKTNSDSGSTLDFSEDFLALDAANRPSDSFTDTDNESPKEEDDEEWARQILEAEEQEETGPKNQLLDAIMAAEAPDSENPESAEAAVTEEDYSDSEFQTTEGWMAELLGSDEQQDESPLVVPDLESHAAAPADAEEEPDQEYVPEIFRKNSKLLDNIQADPLEMQLGRHIRPWMRQGLLAVAIVLAGGLLAAQYAWHNSERMARNPEYRGFFADFCQASGCTMPTAHDIGSIKNSNLVVLKHPRAENALLLDTIITNYASFEQPFPRLYVEFSNLQDQPVASRTFEPEQYLGGDLQGAEMMPVRRPIHLSLELIDPGETAVNYKIVLLPPAGTQ